MSLLKKLAGLAVGAAAVGAAVYVLQKREHGEEYEHIVGPADEVETDTAEPEADASAEAEKAPAAAPETDDAVYQPPVAAQVFSTLSSSSLLNSGMVTGSIIWPIRPSARIITGVRYLSAILKDS